jgi:CheY-like chemotaxis protein
MLLEEDVASKVPAKNRLHILAVDDEPAVAQAMTYVLEAPHRKFAVAKDGKQALAFAERNKFDILITDHRMPRAGGLDVVRQLRQRNFAGKILLISAHLSPDHISAYEGLGVDAIIEKPVASNKLLRIVRRLEKAK